jgi:hypothetical protein
MRLIAVSVTLAAAAIVAGCTQPNQAPTATAAAAPAPTFQTAAGNQRYVSVGVVAAPGCPGVQWDIFPSGPPGSYRGIVFYSDLRGVGYLNGTIDNAGKISGTVESVYQDGPAGTLTGMRTANGVQVQLMGTGCSNITVTLPSRTLAVGGGRG